ncbi:hypothetical protein [Rufibacter soli]
MYILTQEMLHHLTGKDALEVTTTPEPTFDPLFLHGIRRTIATHGPHNLNIDAQDFELVLEPTGAALVGVAEANGPDRAAVAIQKALRPSPEQKRALAPPIKIILGITTRQEAQLAAEELDGISDYLEQVLGEYSDITFGMGVDKTLPTDCMHIVIGISCLQGALV